MIIHPIPPVWDRNSKVLILGSFPSVKSREQMFFYGHPQNRFWKVISAVLDVPTPDTTDEKKKMLLGAGIAVWDVIASCDITGSSDSSIKNAASNDISEILTNADIRAIFTNGKTAFSLYEKHMKPKYATDALYLPSTSPANAAWSVERLTGSWAVISEYLK